jgi:hypothetical protein
MIVNLILGHVSLETLLNHWRAVLELMQKALISVLPTWLGFEWRSTYWVWHGPLHQ